MARKASEFGYDGLELACWGDHFEVDKALSDDGYCAAKRDLLEKYDLQLFAISNHLVGQAVLDTIDERHKSILPEYVWGDGKPEGVNQRAAEEMKNTARAAQKLGVTRRQRLHRLEHLAPGLLFPAGAAEDDRRRLRAAGRAVEPDSRRVRECGVKFALEVHPTEIAFDIYSAQRALEALDRREEFGFNFDPSHLLWQGVDPVEFIRVLPRPHLSRAHEGRDRDAQRPHGHPGQPLALRRSAPRLGFPQPGRGGVDFEEIIRALNQAGYAGPLSVEWEDSGMDREHGASEACEFVQRLDFTPSNVQFDAAFAES